MFDSNFHFVMSFSDPAVPKDLAPYGMREINGKLWVTFTSLNKRRTVLSIFSTLTGPFSNTTPSTAHSIPRGASHWLLTISANSAMRS